MNIFLVLLLLVTSLLACESPQPQAGSTAPARYSEPHRPQFHFSPDSMWMNDPNGMVFFDGEYHLFYQFYPDSTVWGPMHWGHAVSRDMVRWEHLPIALYPDSLGYIFSGSAVIDHRNTSGFGDGSTPPMVAIFTQHDIAGEQAGQTDYQTQSIAYSLDKGRTWTKYAANPVIPNPGIKDFRDPKVIWHDATGRWVMVLAAYDKAMFYTSPDLKTWAYASEFGIEGDKRLWECPDLFPMRAAGSDTIAWILITSIQQQGPNGGTATSYFVGDFDGNTFTANPSEQRWLDHGKDNYAMVTWSNVPDGRTLALGWMSNWQYAQVVPTMRWRSAMTLPRHLQLSGTSGGPILRSAPAREVENLRGHTLPLAAGEVENGMMNLAELASPLMEIQFQFSPEQSSARRFGLIWTNDEGDSLRLGFDRERNGWFVDRSQAGASDFSKEFAGIHLGPELDSAKLDLRIFLDWSSLEAFCEAGDVSFTEIFFPNEPMKHLAVFAEGGKAVWGPGSRWELKRIW